MEPKPVHRLVIEWEWAVLDACAELKARGIAPGDRNYWGTLHTNVCQLARLLEEKGGFCK